MEKRKNPKKWCSIEKEAFAIHYSLDKLDHYSIEMVQHWKRIFCNILCIMPRWVPPTITLQWQFGLEFGQTAITGEGNVQLEDYHNDATNKPSFFISEAYTEAVLQTQSTYAENLDLDTAAGFDTSSVSDDILDFTETNPFGEVNT